MKNLLFVTLLSLSSFTVFSSVTQAAEECYTNSLCDYARKQEAESKAREQARLSCIRAGNDPSTCPKF